MKALNNQFFWFVIGGMVGFGISSILPLFFGTNIFTLFNLFISVGLISGIYHGVFNNNIYHNSGKHKNLHEKIHTIWIHVICGIAGATCLYPLYGKFTGNFSSRIDVSSSEVILLIFGLILISGLGPMILWFLVLSVSKLQDAFEKFIERMLK